MTIRQNDMAVFQFMMQVTKCEKTSSSSFAQLKNTSHPICMTNEGFGLTFADPTRQAHIKKLMTPRAEQALREVVVGVQAEEAERAAKVLTQADKKLHARKGADDDDDDAEPA